MAAARLDPEIVAHLEWLGFVRPTGLVVSAPALVRAGAILDRRDAEGQKLLRAAIDAGNPRAELVRDASPAYGDRGTESPPPLRDFRTFAESVLGWSFSPKGYAGTPEHPIPSELEFPLPDYGETLRPDIAIREPEPKDGEPAWQLLVRVLDPEDDFDRVRRNGGDLEASAHGRMERLLRQTGVPAGLLFNGHALRLVSAPRGESSGWLDFKIADMVQTAGRPISTAMRLLLGETRLLALPRGQRLAALLDDSRKFQNEVSERLAEQVLHALYELLRGLQAAHDASKGQLLREPLAEQPDEIYRALLTVILRLVFLLYAEERDMVPQDGTFLRSYSLGGLYDRLREDAALFPDTMDQRYGAWAQLLVLFRLIHDGAETDAMRLPKRHGVLFDPDRFPFLEGRLTLNARGPDKRIVPPLVSDGTIYRALEDLLVLDGERISYRALDVEQIGSVYETMMGFRLETVIGPSVAIRAQKKQGAPTAVDLEALLAEPGTKRDKWIQERADRKLSDSVRQAVAAATTREGLHAALLPVVDLAATPDVVPKGAMVLQPTEERRRSGSYYTPRSLTQPIVKTTLEPILRRLRGSEDRAPRPEQILDLKVCDPAMGSGAFLVEACRQLGDALIESWRVHGGMPAIPADEDEIIFARRLVAQRCLYGVDRNPVAVDLAKVSLWLVTLAKDHALTFLDHALRHGDSLVGLSRTQIEAFHWAGDAPRFQAGFETMRVREHVVRITELRQRIREARESVSDRELRDVWNEVQRELDRVRLFGDLVVASFFEAEKPRDREAKRSEYAAAVVKGDAGRYRSWLEKRRHGEPPLAPFHWEVEFPEVFDREKPGFDAVVGNPPFLGGNKIWASIGEQYQDFLSALIPGSGGRAVDLVALFFRRGFMLLRSGGTLGLIATKTIAQGDTRRAGLGAILQGGGCCYAATKRREWPGAASVVVSVVHVAKNSAIEPAVLDGKIVPGVNSHLLPRAGELAPIALVSNAGVAFMGCHLYGAGFKFDDADPAANPVRVMHELFSRDPRNREVISKLISGEDITTSPTHDTHRWSINFREMSLSEAQRWPEVMAIVERRVRPEREKLGGYSVARSRAERWWIHGTYAASLYRRLAERRRCLVLSQVSARHAITFHNPANLFTHSVVVIVYEQNSAFAVLQSRAHEVWARLFSSTLEDRLRYTPSDCFETFPFPANWEIHPALEAAGKAYYDFRAALMVRNDEGMTKTYNRFHDPNEEDPDILKLRELHAAMDRAVLDAYGWSDIPTACEFLLDYEIDEEEWGDKKKPWRYRWHDDVRDEVLARLLELNAARAKEEARSGAAVAKKSGQKTSSAKRPRGKDASGDLFG